MNTLKSFRRGLVAAFAAVSGAVSSFAEGTSTAAVQWEGSTAADIAQAAQGTLTNFLTGVGGVVALVIIGGLAVWGGIALVGLIKRAFQTGKGR